MPRFFKLLRLAVLLVSLVSVTPLSALAGKLPYIASNVFPNLTFDKPLYITHPRDGSDRLFVVEQEGRIFAFTNHPDVESAILVLDIRERVRIEHNEEGLLGLAFDPGMAKNHFVYLHYSASKPRRNVLARYTISHDGWTIDPSSEVILLEVKQPYGNHNGGMIEFGPDGYLYVSFGDGGWGGDPHNNAQRTDNLLGKILRIDVHPLNPLRKYVVPRDNPFVNKRGARSEIWAFGLRNVWRFSFDRLTGQLWGGDVGQNKYEEIDVIYPGLNYGWSYREGFEAYKHRESTTEFEEPIVHHTRDEAMSITGGYVYRGKRLKELVGAYIYGDFIMGHIWQIRHDGVDATKPERIAKGSGISSFGEDRDGEIYFTSFDGLLYTLDVRSK